MVAGRTTEPRSVTGVGTTSASGAITGPAGSFSKSDIGRSISGTGIPASATISAVASATAATIAPVATATGTVTVTIGTATTHQATGQGYGFVGWSPETDAESQSYTLAANNAGTVPPDRITDLATGVATKQRARG